MELVAISHCMTKTVAMGAKWSIFPLACNLSKQV